MTFGRYFAFTLAAVATTAPAHAEPAQQVNLRERPDHVTEGTVIVAAAPARIYELMTDYASWPKVLGDVEWAKVQAGGRRDARVRFRSRALGHEVTVLFDNVPDRAIRFRGVEGPPGGRASGAFELEPIDNGVRTRVTASLYMDVVGVPGLFVRDRSIRSMREAKLRADLSDVAARFAGAAPRS